MYPDVIGKEISLRKRRLFFPIQKLHGIFLNFRSNTVNDPINRIKTDNKKMAEEWLHPSAILVICAELTQRNIYIGAPEEGKQSCQKQFLQIFVCFTSEEPDTVIREFGFLGW